MAFVRIGQFKALPASADAMREVYERDAIPIIRAAPGNISAMLLQQRDAPDAFMAITIWATSADADAYERSGAARQMVDKIRFGFAGPPVLTTHDAFGIDAAAP